MIYLLDTNVCIQYLNRRSSAIIAKLATLQPQNIVLCDVVKAELWYGAYKSLQREKNLALYREFFSLFVSLPFDSKSAEVFGQIRVQLENQGTPIGAYDLQIAAVALAHDLILVTHNTKEFSRINGLCYEDWEV